MRLQTNTTATTTASNTNHSYVTDTIVMKPTTTTVTATNMTDSVGLTEAQVPEMTGGMAESDRGVSGSNDGKMDGYSSHNQVITHTDTSSHDPELELDDPIDDDQDDAMREQDQARQYDDDVMAVARLGEWLREQQTMEDALVLLQQEGWMF